MKTIAITTKHITSSKNNNFTYTFPQEIDLTNKQIGLASLNMFYSMYNISSAKNNNQVQYIYNGTTYTVTFPDMIAEVADMNSYLQFVFRSNNHYLNHENGSVLYPINIFIDQARYAIAVVCNEIPNSFSTTYPSTSNTHFTLPTSSFIPQFKMLATNDFHKLIGFANDYITNVSNASSSKTDFSIVSPILNPDANLLVNLDNGIDNRYAVPSGILHSFSVNVAPSSQIVERPSQIAFVDCQAGFYDRVSLRILNADTLADIDIRDPEIAILLLIKDKNE